MSRYEDFLRVQATAYENFGRLAEETKQRGIKTDPYFSQQYSGFYVNLTHSAAAAHRAAEFSRGIGALIPSTVYNAGDVHTTLASLAALNSQVNPDSKEHCGIMDDLIAVAREAVCGLSGRRVVIDYNRYLHSDFVAIVAGVPQNEAFVDLFSAIIHGAKLRGRDLKPPWAAHMTLARFMGDVPAEKLGPFFRFIETAPPPGRSVPTHVNIGFNSWSYGDPRAARGGHFVRYGDPIPLGD